MAVEDLLHPLLFAYLNSPQWVKSSVGHAYSMVPLALRRGRQYNRFVAEASLQSFAEIRQLSSARLARALQHAIETVPAYRRYRDLLGTLDTPEDVLRELPLVSKAEMRSDPSQFMSTAVDPRLRLKMFTGGTTAEPMTFYLHKGISRAKEYAYIEQFHRRAGLGEGEVLLTLRGYAVPGTERGRRWMYEPIRKQLFFSTDHLEPRFMPEYVQAMREWKPVCIQGFASALYPLAQWLKEHPAPDVTAHIRGVMLFSESVLDHQTALLKEVFPCPVLKHYGHSERVVVAASMADDDRYFFWPQYGHVELVDHTGRPVTEAGALGEIVGTGFDNEVMSFIRYRTGDMAVLSDRPHPALPGFPAVERIEGRMQEFVVCSDGRLITLNSMTTIVQDQCLEGIEALQYEQHQAGHVVMKIVAPYRLPAAARERIARRLEVKMQGRCDAEVVQVDSIARTRRGKFQMLIQHADISHYFGQQVSHE